MGKTSYQLSYKKPGTAGWTIRSITDQSEIGAIHQALEILEKTAGRRVSFEAQARGLKGLTTFDFGRAELLRRS